MQRAIVSVITNIAEGFERGSNKEFVKFLFVAKASAGEVRSLLYVALDLAYIDSTTFEEINNSIPSISKQIRGFIKYLKNHSRKER